MRNKMKIDAMMTELRELTELPVCCLKSEEDKLAMVRDSFNMFRFVSLLLSVQLSFSFSYVD